MNHSTGEYHYHHGYPAHDHINGTCPYDFDDQTGRNSGASSGSSHNTSASKKATEEGQDDIDWLGVILASLSSAIFLCCPAGFLFGALLESLFPKLNLTETQMIILGGLLVFGSSAAFFISLV